LYILTVTQTVGVDGISNEQPFQYYVGNVFHIEKLNIPGATVVFEEAILYQSQEKGYICTFSRISVSREHDYSKFAEY
jgi:hypothetical protein